MAFQSRNATHQAESLGFRVEGLGFKVWGGESLWVRRKLELQSHLNAVCRCRLSQNLDGTSADDGVCQGLISGLILGGPWDLVSTYNWAYNPNYNPPK